MKTMIINLMPNAKLHIEYDRDREMIIVRMDNEHLFELTYINAQLMQGRLNKTVNEAQMHNMEIARRKYLAEVKA